MGTARLTGLMPSLSPNQQRQSTEGINQTKLIKKFTTVNYNYTQGMINNYYKLLREKKQYNN